MISPKLDNVLFKAGSLCGFHATAIQVGVVLVGPFHLVIMTVIMIMSGGLGSFIPKIRTATYCRLKLCELISSTFDSRYLFEVEI